MKEFFESWRKKAVPPLLIYFLFLNWLDYSLTLQAISIGITEANPLMRPIIGTIWNPLIKLLIPGAFMIFSLWLFHKTYEKLPAKTLKYWKATALLIVVLYLFVVVNNWIWIQLYGEI